MSGKGSHRRPATISEEQLAANWAAVDWSKGRTPAPSVERIERANAAWLQGKTETPVETPPLLFDCGHSGYLSAYPKPDGSSQCTSCANRMRGV